MINQIMTVSVNECVQHNASLAITGAIKGTSRLKLCNEIELEPLELR